VTSTDRLHTFSQYNTNNDEQESTGAFLPNGQMNNSIDGIERREKAVNQEPTREGQNERTSLSDSDRISGQDKDMKSASPSNELENEPGRTPGQAEGTRSGSPSEELENDPGRTPGQAEGEREPDMSYDYQRREVRQNISNGSSNRDSGSNQGQKHNDQMTRNMQSQAEKIRSQVESGIERFNRSLNEGGTASQMRDQFRSMAQNQEFSVQEIKRWLAMIGGGLLAFQSLRRSLGNLTLAGIGAALFYWGFSGESPLNLLQRSGKTTHQDAESRIRSGETHKSMNVSVQPRQVTRSIIVKGNTADVYKVWANFENFPHFMQHIKSVRKTGDGLSHWVMEGPLGTRIEWDAKTTRAEENKRIGWSSIQGDIKTSGQVTFNNLPDNQTEVTVVLQYIPPAGMAGAAVAELFGNPEGKLEEDLRNFKRFMENRTR
jgi:uncharacterized membrane protein